MQDYIDKMEPRGPQSMDQSVQSKAEDDQWAVGFVGLRVRHRVAPKVIAEHLLERCIYSVYM